VIVERRLELRNAGVLAAREARQRLAQAIALLDEPGADHAAAMLAAQISHAVGALFGCEIGDAVAVLEKLRAASAVLSGVLTRMHGPAVGTRADEAGALVAASLAVLYPVRAGFERELDESRPKPSRPARRSFTVKGSTIVRETVDEVLPPEERAALEEIRSRASATVIDPAPPVSLAREGPQAPPDQTLFDPAPPVHIEAREDAPRPARPVRAEPAAEPPPSPALAAATSLFPEMSEDALPPLLLTERRSARPRRVAVELVPDGSGELVGAGAHRVSEPARERRVQERVEMEVDIGLHSATQFYAGLSNDISEGGLFVSTVRPLPVGSQLSLSFVLPGGHAVTTEGRVAWLAAPRDDDSRAGMGIRFLRLEPAHRAAIERFLQHRPPMLHEL
jgi:uncharacterized protein (TIGR02266 family)